MLKFTLVVDNDTTVQRMLPMSLVLDAEWEGESADPNPKLV